MIHPKAFLPQVALLQRLAVLISSIGAVAFAQQPLAFEVASIKPRHSGDHRDPGLSFLPGGRLVATGITVRGLIVTAYDLPMPNRVSDGPAWINAEEYDVEATAPADAVPAELSAKDRGTRVRAMLQTLLAERFKLLTHRDTKEMSVYRMVVSKGGSKLHPAKIDNQCNSSEVSICQNFSSGPDAAIHGRAVTTGDLAKMLEKWSDRPILDQTGIEGLFDIDIALPWPIAADSNLPSIFTVIDPLGLKLEPKKGPVEIFVVDRVERPDAN